MTESLLCFVRNGAVTAAAIGSCRRVSFSWGSGGLQGAG